MGRVALTVDLVGNQRELDELCGVLEANGVRATFFAPGNIVDQKQIETVLEKKHEIGSHTFSHPNDLTAMSDDQLENDIVSGHEALKRMCGRFGFSTAIRGFRSPLFMFDERIPRTLSKMNYLWDSSHASFPALRKPFVVSRYESIVEMPCLFPQDINLFGQLGLDSGTVEQLWREAYKASGDCFVWSIHPRVIAKNKERLDTLNRFLNFLKKDGAELMTLTEMAESIQHQR